MSNVLGMAATDTTASGGRYREADRALWRAHGLDPVERWIDVAAPAARIHVLEVGSGEPVLLIGGTGGTGAAWAPLVAQLPDRRVIVIDRPGWGLSSPISYRGTDFAQLATGVVEAVMDGLEVPRADVIGASIGGLWGVHVARRLPERVRRLVLIGGMPHRDVPLPTFIKLLRSPLGAVLVRIPAGPGMVHKQLEALGHGTTLARGGMSDYIAWRVAFQRETPSMRNERAMVQAITTGDGFRPGVLPGEDELAGMRQPTLMVFGTADPTGSPELWRRFVDDLPDGALHLVEAGGHNPQWDAPSDVGQRVAGFLTGPMAAA